MHAEWQTLRGHVVRGVAILVPCAPHGARRDKRLRHQPLDGQATAVSEKLPPRASRPGRLVLAAPPAAVETRACVAAGVEVGTEHCRVQQRLPGQQQPDTRARCRLDEFANGVEVTSKHRTVEQSQSAVCFGDRLLEFCDGGREYRDIAGVIGGEPTQVFKDVDKRYDMFCTC